MIAFFKEWRHPEVFDIRNIILPAGAAHKGGRRGWRPPSSGDDKWRGGDWGEVNHVQG